MTWVDALQRASITKWRDVFLLERAERAVESYATASRPTMLEYLRAGTARANAANDFLDHQPAAARLLYREAALLFAAAVLVSRGKEVDVRDLTLADALGEIKGILPELAPPPMGFEDAWRHLTDRDPMAFDRMPESDAATAISAIADTVRWLGDAVEPRSIKQIRLMRMVRVGVLGAAALFVVVWGAIAVFSPPNIALHKPATQSSVHPASTAPRGGLTDGSLSGGYGVHTNVEDDAWVQVDLEAVYNLKKIKIYNRGDGWFDDGLPFTLELSENGTDFAIVDKRTTTFSQWSPWVYSAGGKRARYIRVRAAKGKYVSLAELEAYGSK